MSLSALTEKFYNMTNIQNFKGFIKGIKYQAYLTKNLPEYSFSSFDINRANSFGIIKDNNTEPAFLTKRAIAIRESYT
jgi:hypothetical protein